MFSHHRKPYTCSLLVGVLLYINFVINCHGRKTGSYRPRLRNSEKSGLTVRPREISFHSDTDDEMVRFEKLDVSLETVGISGRPETGHKVQ